MHLSDFVEEFKKQTFGTLKEKERHMGIPTQKDEADLLKSIKNYKQIEHVIAKLKQEEHIDEKKIAKYEEIQLHYEQLIQHKLNAYQMEDVHTQKAYLAQVHAIEQELVGSLNQVHEGDTRKVREMQSERSESPSEKIALRYEKEYAVAMESIKNAATEKEARIEEGRWNSQSKTLATEMNKAMEKEHKKLEDLVPTEAIQHLQNKIGEIQKDNDRQSGIDLERSNELVLSIYPEKYDG